MTLSTLPQSLNKLDSKLPEQYIKHLTAEGLTKGKVKEFLTIHNKLCICPKTLATIHCHWVKFSDLPFNIHWL